MTRGRSPATSPGQRSESSEVGGAGAACAAAGVTYATAPRTNAALTVATKYVERLMRSPALVPRTRSSHYNFRKSGCELRVQSGTRIIDWLVSFDSEVRIGRAERSGELRNPDTSAGDIARTPAVPANLTKPRCGQRDETTSPREVTTTQWPSWRLISWMRPSPGTRSPGTISTMP